MKLNDNKNCYEIRLRVSFIYFGLSVQCWYPIYRQNTKPIEPAEGFIAGRIKLND